MPSLPSSEIDQIELRHWGRLETKKDSIFYQLIPTSTGFLAFYRSHFAGHELKSAIYDKVLNFVQNLDFTLEGEDPRAFQHRGDWYITDNFWGRNKISCLEDFSTVYDRKAAHHQDGKNPSYISHEGGLYFVKWFYPLELYQFNEDLSDVHLYFSDSRMVKDGAYRGGTAGFATTEDGVFVGFGHYTLEKPNLRHYPFIWKLNMRTFELQTRVLKFERMSNIFDPVTIIFTNGKYFLVTAESEKGWFCKQDYITNIWEIVYP